MTTAKKRKGAFTCDELLDRLEEHSKPIPKGVSYADFQAEQTIEKLKQDLEALRNQQAPLKYPDGTLVMPSPIPMPEAPAVEPEKDEAAEMSSVIVQELKKIVDTFNSSFDTWAKTYKCVTNFNWIYTGEEGGKRLEIATVDYIVYRKPAPGERTIKDVLEKAPRAFKEK